MGDIETNEADERIIQELRKGRNRPSNLASQLNYSREYISQRLKRLREHGVVARPDSGIYELNDRSAPDLSEAMDEEYVIRGSEKDIQLPRELWEEWRASVPQDKSLRDRLLELMEADRDGELHQTEPQDRDTTPTPSPSTPEEPRSDTPASGNDTDLLEAMDLPEGKDPDAALEAVHAARDYLDEHGPASMREIVSGVMPEHPLGYDVPQLESGDRFRGAWWRRIIQPGLQSLPDVKYRKNHGDYRTK